MPLLKPKLEEPRDKFVSRCMSSAQMKKEFPNKEQRLAVCFSQFRKKREAEIEENTMLTRSISTELNLCSSDDDEGTFEGHAAIFGKLNAFDEVVVPGAFKKSLRARSKHKVKMLRQHQQGMIIGVWEEIREDAEGLFVKGRLLTEIQSAKETLILLKAKALVAYHDGRGSQEGIFSELKSQCHMGYVPVRTLIGNQLYLLAALFAHNLIRELQMMTSPRSRRTTPQRAALWVFEKLDPTVA